MVSNPARQVIVESSGVNITQSENGWELAITDNGRQWQSDSSEDYLILVESRKQNAAAVIIKDGAERIRAVTAATADEQDHKTDTATQSGTDKNTSREALQFRNNTTDPEIRAFCRAYVAASNAADFVQVAFFKQYAEETKLLIDNALKSKYRVWVNRHIETVA